MTHTPGLLKIGRVDHKEQVIEIDAVSSTAWANAYPWEGLITCHGDDEYRTQGSAVMEANARRVVACWNACLDVPTEVLENLADDGATIAPIYRDLLVQRDELLKALKLAAEINPYGSVENAAARDAAIVAIRKVSK
jgi:hypothetical protein